MSKMRWLLGGSGLFLFTAVLAVVITQWPPATSKYRAPGEISPQTVANPESQWPVFGGDDGGGQYSPLAQITRENVRGLRVAWVHHSGDLINDRKNKRNSTAYEVTPVHANNSLYYCTPLNRIFALDPVTGEEKWSFDPHAEESGVDGPLVATPRHPGFCRGVTYWEASAEVRDTAGSQAACLRRIFKNDTYGRTFAVDADTGQACRDFGAAVGHPGYVSHWDYPVNGEDPFRGSTSPPSVIGNILVTASGANDSVAQANDGIVRGWNAQSGELVWEFNPIPEEHREATGAANVWGMITADPELDLIYVPTTSPSPDFFGGTRQFDMPLTNAIVALEAQTGKVRWSFQTTHHDLWDYDNGAHPLLVTIRKDGQLRDVAILQTKMGYVFVFDRATGEPLWPIEERAVPTTSMSGDKSAPTQPAPSGIASFAHQEFPQDKVWGVTPFDRSACRAAYDKHRYEGMYTAPSAEGTVTLPSVFGGGNWGGAAYDPDTNQLIVKAQNLSMILKLTELSKAGDEPWSYSSRELEGTPYRFNGTPFLSPFGIPCNPPPWGTLTAIDMDSGEVTWSRPLGQSRRFGLLVPDWLGWGAPNVAGPLATGGGLVFIGATMDGIFRAFDIDTGEELWRNKLPAPGISVPMTYYEDGKQFVVIAAGGAARVYDDLDDAIVAYTLQ